MPPIKVNHVLSCSSEDTVHKAENMLLTDHYRKWKSAQVGEKQVTLVLQLERSSIIHSIDIGNEGSAFVEVLVGRSSDPEQKFEVLLVTSSFMTPLESRQGTGINRVRMFGPEKMCQTVSKNNWDLVKIVCTQPFNKSIQYGLSFVVFNSPPDKNESFPNKQMTQPTLGSFKLKSPEDSENHMAVGSWFAKRKSDSQEVDPLTGPAAIRSAVSDSSPIMPKKIRKVIKDKCSPGKDVESSTTSQNNLTPDTTFNKQSDNKITNKMSDNGNLNSSTKSGSSKIGGQNSVKNVLNTKISPKASTLNGQKTMMGSKTEEKQIGSQNKINPKVSKTKQQKPFHNILEHVVFALSGYQNPQRGQIRDKAIEMGAKYKPDWDKDCTHLICAFMNTPKFQQVQAKGGKIVKEKWILECFKERKALPWKYFQLGKSKHPDTSDSDASDSEHEATVKKKITKLLDYKNTPSTSTTGSTNSPSTGNINNILTQNPKIKNITQKNNVDEFDSDEIYDAATDVESDSGCDTETELAKVELKKTLKPTLQSTDKKNTSTLPLPSLPDMFDGTLFFLYGEFHQKEKKLLVRYITGCSGQVKEYMSKEVKYVLTNSKWSKDFTAALNENKSLRIVKPNWILECLEQGCVVPHSNFFVSRR